MDRQLIHQRLQRLARQDRKRKVFGAASHNYVLNPPLPLCTVVDFEEQHSVRLPDDYRQFITEIGNGGAGPDYGLFPFGQQDGGFDLEPWSEGFLLGDVSQPFAHTSAWNLDDAFWVQEPDPPEGLSEEEEDRLWEAWDRILEAEYWNPSIMNGAIPVCHRGCVLRQWLVVHGPQGGDNFRADNAGIASVTDAQGNHLTFADWYFAWLGEAEKRCRIRGV